MTKLLVRSFIAAVLIVLAASPVPVWAQAETGRVTGVVFDQQGGVVPGATVTLTSTTTAAARTSVSDAEGRYVLANIQPGAYSLLVELSGFAPQRRDVVVTVGGNVAVETRLSVAATTEVVQVVAESPFVNTRNSEVAVTVREAQIRELPTLTRNVYDLVALAGNVVEASEEAQGITTARGAGFNINGARSASTNILLDGAANNDEFTASVGQAVPLDSIQEFAVITNNFSAQYGRATGGIVNAITKSGGNAFRGTAYEFFRSDELSTNTVDNKANDLPKGDFSRHQPGYSIGGPLMRDKLFFFSSLEYIRVRSADTEISWVPTPEFLAASSPATRAFFQQYGQGVDINGPTLSRAEVSGIVGSGAGAFNALPAGLPVFGRVEKTLPIDAGGGDPQDNYQFIGRVDWNSSGNTNAYIRYAMQNQSTEPGTVVSSPYDGFDTGEVNKNHNILGSFTHVFSPRFTSQTKLVFNRLYNEQPLNGDPVPTLFMNSTGAVRLQGYRIAFPGYGPWTPGNAIPFGGPQKFIQFYQDSTWLKGSHDIRMGGNYVNMADDRTFGAYMNSVEFLSIAASNLNSLNNLVTGNIERFQTAINPGGFPGGFYTTPVSLPSFLSNNRYNEFALYIQDNWSVANRLTVNLGLRYEYYGPQKKTEPKVDSNFYYADANASVNTSTPVELIQSIRNGQVLLSTDSPTGTLWKPDWNNWAPRLGFAWDVTGDGQTSVRAGYGISYERNIGNVTFNTLFNPPDYLVSTIEAPSDVPSLGIETDLAGPFGGVAGVTKPIPIGSLRHVDQNIETAYAHQYGVSLQRQLGSGISGAIEYNGSSGRKLYDLADVNKRGAPLIYEGIGTGATRPHTGYAAFNTRGNRGQSQYHGVTFSFDTREIARSGLSLTSKYTVSSAKDNLSTTFSEGTNFFNLGYLDPWDPMLDYGYAEFDVRHRASVSAMWNLPFLRDGTGVKESLLGGWAVNTIFSARSGFPFTIYDCTNARAVCMRALATDGFSRKVSSGTATGNPNEYTLLDYAPIAGLAGSYVNPQTGDNDWGPYPANMTERDEFRGPGAWFFDLALQKRFRFTGTKAAVFRLEVYNLFEHANMYILPETAEIEGNPALLGRRSGILAGSADANRRLQLGFKFEF